MQSAVVIEAFTMVAFRSRRDMGHVQAEIGLI